MECYRVNLVFPFQDVFYLFIFFSTSWINLYCMVWYGMVWYGMVWYGMVWCGMVWYGMVWYGMVWHGLIRYGTAQYGLVRSGLGSLYGMACVASHGPLLSGVMWHGSMSFYYYQIGVRCKSIRINKLYYYLSLFVYWWGQLQFDSFLGFYGQVCYN